MRAIPTKYYIQETHTYVLKLLLNIFSAKTVALVVSENKQVFVCLCQESPPHVSSAMLCHLPSTPHY